MSSQKGKPKKCGTCGELGHNKRACLSAESAGASTSTGRAIVYGPTGWAYSINPDTGKKSGLKRKKIEPTDNEEGCSPELPLPPPQSRFSGPAPVRRLAAAPQ